MMSEEPILSEREREILALVATGLSNREIAQQLTISHNTVKVHLRNIFEKTGVVSRTGAARYGMEHGLVELPAGAVTAPEQPGWRELARQYRWWIGGALLVVAALVGLLILSLASRPPEPELAGLPDRWQKLTPLPEPRAAMAAAAYDGQVYVIAGEGSEGVSGSVFRYDPPGDAWAQLADKPTPVADVHAALIGEKLYVPGGRLASGEVTDTLEIYDPRRDTWETGAPPPVALSAYALAGFEGSLYLFGGWDGERARDEVWIYDPGEDAWREGNPMPAPRYHHGAAVLGDRVVLLGGENQAGTLAMGVSYYPARDVDGEDPWEDFTDLPEARPGFGLAAVSETLYLLGGGAGDQVSPLGFVFSDGEWSEMTDKVGSSDYSSRAVTVASLIYYLIPTSFENQTEFWSYQAFYYEIFIPIVQ